MLGFDKGPMTCRCVGLRFYFSSIQLIERGQDPAPFLASTIVLLPALLLLENNAAIETLTLNLLHQSEGGFNDEAGEKT